MSVWFDGCIQIDRGICINQLDSYFYYSLLPITLPLNTQAWRFGVGLFTWVIANPISLRATLHQRHPSAGLLHRLLK